MYFIGGPSSQCQSPFSRSLSLAFVNRIGDALRRVKGDPRSNRGVVSVPSNVTTKVRWARRIEAERSSSNWTILKSRSSSDEELTLCRGCRTDMVVHGDAAIEGRRRRRRGVIRPQSGAGSATRHGGEGRDHIEPRVAKEQGPGDHGDGREYLASVPGCPRGSRSTVINAASNPVQRRRQ